jgi:hypothetical protein
VQLTLPEEKCLQMFILSMRVGNQMLKTICKNVAFFLFCSLKENVLKTNSKKDVESEKYATTCSSICFSALHFAFGRVPAHLTTFAKGSQNKKTYKTQKS